MWPARLCIMAILALNFLAAQQDLEILEKDRVNRLTNKGLEQLQSGAYDMARKSLEEATNLSGGDMSLSPLCEIYRLTGDYDKALNVAQKMGKGGGKILAGEILMDIGRYEEAKDAFLEAYRDDPESIRLRYDIGNYYYLRGQREKYMEYFGDIFDNYDAYEENYTAEDLTYIAKACRIYAMKASQKHIDRSDTLDTIVNVILPAAIDKDRHYFAAYREMVDVLLDAFEQPSSKTTLDESLNLNPHHPHLLVAQAAYQMQVYDPKAMSTLDYALTVNPNLVEALSLKAAIYLGDEEYDKAQESLKKALAVNPRDVTAMSLTAAFYHMQGRQTAYENECRKVLEINPDCGELYYTVAQMVLHKRQFADAVDLSRKAIELDPYLWHAYIELARNLFNIGEVEEAQKYLDTIQSEYRLHVQSYNTRMLIKGYKDYKVYHTPHFTIRMHINEAEAMYPIVSELLEHAYRTLSQKYEFEPTCPILFEMFPTHRDFSVRVIGLDTIGASGACFGKVVAVGSPGAMPKGAINWASVVWHEFTHVITLQATDYKIPRWFTEGLSELSEQERNPSVDRRLDLELYSAYCSGTMRKMADLNAGFTRPRYAEEIVLCYYQAKLVCEFICSTYGFPKVLEMLALYRGEKKDREVFQAALSMTLEKFDETFLKWLGENLFAQMEVFPGIDPGEIQGLKDRLFEKPDDVDTHLKLCLGYLQQGKYRDAEIYASRLLDLATDKPIGYDVMGYLEYRMGNSSQAKNLLEKASQLGSNNFYTHWVLGMLHWYRFRDPGNAISSFERAKKIYPSYVRANNPYQKLAEIYFAQKEEEKAFAELELYLQRQGTDFATRMNLAQRYFELKRYEKATQLLREARDIYPMDIKVHDLLAKNYRACQQWGEVVKTLEVMPALSPAEDRPKIYADMAEGCYQSNQLERARLYAQKTLEIDPTNELAKKILKMTEK